MVTMKTVGTVYNHENTNTMNYSITIKKIGTTRITTSSSPCKTNSPVTTLTSTITWRTTCIESAHIAHCSQLLLMIHIAHSWLKKPWAPSHFIHGHPHDALSLIPFLPVLFPLPPVCHRLPFLPRVVPWNPLHEDHGKLAQSRCRKWGQFERFHLSNKLWVQFPWPLPRTRTWMTWHSARCSQRHTDYKSTSRLLCTRRHVSQSVVVVCNVRWIRTTWWRENGRSLKKIWCHFERD